jgi:hypothetical protein
MLVPGNKDAIVIVVELGKRSVMTCDEHIDRQAYELAKQFLLTLDEAITPTLIEKYLDPFHHRPKPDSKKGIYRSMLGSAQSGNMKRGVVGKAIGGVDKFSVILEDFEPRKVVEKYGCNPELILNDIIEQLRPRGKVRTTTRSIWPQYCRTILSASSNSLSRQRTSMVGLVFLIRMIEHEQAYPCFSAMKLMVSASHCPAIFSKN